MEIERSEDKARASPVPLNQAISMKHVIEAIREADSRKRLRKDCPDGKRSTITSEEVAKALLRQHVVFDAYAKQNYTHLKPPSALDGATSADNENQLSEAVDNIHGRTDKSESAARTDNQLSEAVDDTHGRTGEMTEVLDDFHGASTDENVTVNHREETYIFEGYDYHDTDDFSTGSPADNSAIHIASDDNNAFDHAANNAVGTLSNDAIRQAVNCLIGPAVQIAIGPAVKDAIGPAVKDAIGPAVKDAIGLAVKDAIGPAVKDAIGPFAGAVAHEVASTPGPEVDDIDTPAAGAVISAVTNTTGGAVTNDICPAATNDVGPGVENAVRLNVADAGDGALASVDGLVAGAVAPEVASTPGPDDIDTPVAGVVTPAVTNTTGGAVTNDFGPAATNDVGPGVENAVRLNVADTGDDAVASVDGLETTDANDPAVANTVDAETPSPFVLEVRSAVKPFFKKIGGKMDKLEGKMDKLEGKMDKLETLIANERTRRGNKQGLTAPDEFSAEIRPLLKEVYGHGEGLPGYPIPETDLPLNFSRKVGSAIPAGLTLQEVPYLNNKKLALLAAVYNDDFGIIRTDSLQIRRQKFKAFIS